MLNFLSIYYKKTYKLPCSYQIELPKVQNVNNREVDYILFRYFEITFISHLLLLLNQGIFINEWCFNFTFTKQSILITTYVLILFLNH